MLVLRHDGVGVWTDTVTTVHIYAYGAYMYCAVTTVDVAHAINVGQNSTRASELVMEVSIKYSQVLGARDKR